MNYLGHLYVAGDDPELQLGGLLGDFVRGRDLSAFPEGVARGISLHRSIDAYTDRHPAFRSACEALPAEYRRFSRILIDVYFGHLLARDWQRHQLDAAFDVRRGDLRPLAAGARVVAGQGGACLCGDDGRRLALLLRHPRRHRGGAATADRRLSGPIRLVEALPDALAVSERLESCFGQISPPLPAPREAPAPLAS